jgi:tRNA(Ile)-lysidine synthase
MDNRRLLSPTGNPLHPLEKRVYQELKPLRSKLEGTPIVVAVSGGIDSVVLLHVLVALQSRFKYIIHVVHINHGVRGAASENDSRFVGELADELKVNLIRKKISNLKKNPSENTLREERYALLFAAAKKTGSPFIITAHHRDDLLETRLMRLLHGTGIEGLRAMGMLSETGVMRPFIGLTRRDIENYARFKQLQWRNDATNSDTTKFRNWIRRNWLGVLRTEHPEYLKSLASSLERIVASHSFAPAEKGEQERVFNRLRLKASKGDPKLNQEILSYLRYYGKKRITSRHVEEFKKVLKSPRNKFTFRLAGVDWNVDGSSVSSHMSPSYLI